MEIVGVSFWLVCIATLIYGYSDTPDLCVMTPLTTPYFTPILDTPRKARGCSALSTNPNAPFFARLDTTNRTKPPQDVHVIYLHTIGSPTNEQQSVRLLVMSGGGGGGGGGGSGNESNVDVLDRLVLVLYSDRPVKWLLRTDADEAAGAGTDDVYLASTPWVLISEGSVAEGNFNINVTRHSWNNKKALHRDVKRKFQGIASYTEVKGANHLELKVGATSKSFVQCDMNAQDDSTVVTASLMVQLKTEGCFHEHYIGDNSVDVYVVELEGGGGGGGGGPKGRNKRVGPKSRVPVTVRLLGEGVLPVPRNVTVVLKSHQPIRWQFGARRIHGNIVVVSDREDQVENASEDGGYENLEVRLTTLPDNMVELLMSVTSEYGPPILYAKTAYASTLQLVVGSKNKSAVRSGTESQVFAEVSGERRRTGETTNRELMQQQPNFPGAVFVASFAAHDVAAGDPIVQLKAAMSVHCGKTVIDVTFPRALLKTLGSPQLSLSDRTCVATYNRTHGTLTSHTTSCGYTGQSDGKLTLFSNVVNVNFASPADSDDEDFEASGDMTFDGQIMVMCKYRPHYPGDPNKPGNPAVPDDSLTSEPSQPSLYRLELFRDPALATKVDFKNRDVPEVVLNETLHVKAFIEGVVPVQVVIEECWVSNSSDHRQPHFVTLIRNTCPAEPSARLPAAATSAAAAAAAAAAGVTAAPRTPFGRFSFRVSRDYQPLGQFYLHCRLGLCTLDKERGKGNLKMCVNPAQYCSGLRFYLNQTVSTAQQYSFNGPLRLVAQRRRQQPTTKPARPILPEAAQGTAAETSDVGVSGGGGGGGASVSSGSSSIGSSGARIVHTGVPVEVTVGVGLASFLLGVVVTATLWCIHIKTDPFRQRNKQLGGATTGGGGSGGGGGGGGGGAVANLSPHSGCSSANSQAAITT